MEDISLHILDIAENALKAQATRIEIHVNEDIEHDRLTVQILDNGKGMDERMVQTVTDPFVTTRTERRVGLGLPLLAESARMAGGDIKIKSDPGKATSIEADFVYSHIDRKPLGDMVRTMIVLIAGNPEVDFSYQHQKGDQSYCLDTTELRKTLEEIPINHPEVIKLIKKDLEEGLKEVGVVFY
ncbi:ATP-binding protein [candidate division KSB1 bacterium]|nr:ATP-binding protein [candidate division KSB1 bacterium]